MYKSKIEIREVFLFRTKVIGFRSILWGITISYFSAVLSYLFQSREEKCISLTYIYFEKPLLEDEKSIAFNRRATLERWPKRPAPPQSIAVLQAYALTFGKLEF